LRLRLAAAGGKTRRRARRLALSHPW